MITGGFVCPPATPTVRMPISRTSMLGIWTEYWQGTGAGTSAISSNAGHAELEAGSEHTNDGQDGKPLKDTIPRRECGILDQRLVIQNNTYYRSGIMRSAEKTISFRAMTEKIDALDSLASAQDRSRRYLINEAITNYIELHAYQDALLRKGQEEMRKGRVVSHKEVVKRLKKTGRAS